VAVQLPEERVYYCASLSGDEPLLCWLPQSMLVELAGAGHIAEDLVELYPKGMEVEVEELMQLGVVAGPSAGELLAAYRLLAAQEDFPASGYVRACQLEEQAERLRQVTQFRGEPGAAPPPEAILVHLDEPRMSEGDPPLTALRRLSGRAGGV
jgi:hypothetical protein